MIIIHRAQRATGIARALAAEDRSSREDRINPVYAALLRVFGPPDSPDNPLLGTKYDPRLAAQREREKFTRRRIKVDERWQRWDHRLHGHHPMPPPFQPPGTVDRATGGPTEMRNLPGPPEQR